MKWTTLSKKNKYVKILSINVSELQFEILCKTC